ncbi:MAG: hypothetical protein J0G96_05375 [Flavobacteriia bacterium]|nr:hypothetical protein [Flavobacteriia bacterium]OJX36884.1 MAG: hypothetical protein BGO87_13955 [Flavobacteriia bacterium 40-80]
MKTYIITAILFVILGCTARQNLVEGTFYLNLASSNGDMLRFKADEKDLKRDWNWKYWRITKDSIFQDDSRGLSYFFGKRGRKYSVKNNTLTLYPVSIPQRNRDICAWCYLKSGNTEHNEKIHIGEQRYTEKEQYLVLKSTKDVLEIIDVTDHTAKREPVNDTKTATSF